jgi:23S rRNA-/tRNA-specific pseudouridylate synthase
LKSFKTYLSPNYDETTSLIIPKPKKENDQRRNAITGYRVLDSNNKAALVELQPTTGFQHQLRAHLSFGLGCPILGDHKYSHHIKNAPQVCLIKLLSNQIFFL